MSETRPRSAPGTRTKIAEIATTVLEGRTTASAALKDAAAREPFSETGKQEALRLAKDDPIVGGQQRRLLTGPVDSQ
jgi:hypothetical protein